MHERRLARIVIAARGRDGSKKEERAVWYEGEQGVAQASTRGSNWASDGTHLQDVAQVLCDLPLVFAQLILPHA